MRSCCNADRAAPGGPGNLFRRGSSHPQEVASIARTTKPSPAPAATAIDPFDLAEASDRAAVERVLDGDTEAFAGVVRRHGARLVALCTRMTSGRDVGEELAQESLARAFGALGSYRGDSPFRGWLTRIAVNACRDWRKAGARNERPAELDPRAVAAGPDPERAASGRELGSALGAAITRLAAANREAFVLFHVEGLSYEEMKAITGVSVNALKVRVHRARQRLLEELGPLLGSE